MISRPECREPAYDRDRRNPEEKVGGCESPPRTAAVVARTRMAIEARWTMRANRALRLTPPSPDPVGRVPERWSPLPGSSGPRPLRRSRRVDPACSAARSRSTPRRRTRRRRPDLEREMTVVAAEPNVDVGGSRVLLRVLHGLEAHEVHGRLGLDRAVRRRARSLRPVLRPHVPAPRAPPRSRAPPASRGRSAREVEQGRPGELGLA